MLARTILRRATPVAPRAAVRYMATEATNPKIRNAFTYAADPAAGEAYIKLEEETTHHSKGTGELWRKISIYIVAPIIALTAYHTYLVESEHFEHLAAHPRKPDDETPPEYDYQNIRTSKFFWGDGDKTLFWNDKYNHKKED